MKCHCTHVRAAKAKNTGGSVCVPGGTKCGQHVRLCFPALSPQQETDHAQQLASPAPALLRKEQVLCLAVSFQDKYTLVIPLLDICPGKRKTCVLGDSCMLLHHSIQNSLNRETTQIVVYLYSRYSRIKEIIMIYAATWINVRSTLLSKRRQTQPIRESCNDKQRAEAGEMTPSLKCSLCMHT